jgi:hypothetical protein
MKVTRVSLFALMPLVGAAVLASGPTDATERFGRSGFLRVSKECSGFSGDPGSFCTITVSNTSLVPKGSKIVYGQPGGVPGIGLDSNVVLERPDGDRAMGRCTLGANGGGLCTFSDGTGQLAGFTARVEVTTTDFVIWKWQGTYEFAGPGAGWSWH